MIQKADTPKAKKIWEDIEKAGKYCPGWCKPYIKRAVKEQVQKLKAARIRKNITNKEVLENGF